MRKFFFLFFILTPVLTFFTPSFNNNVYAQTGFNAVLEYCTGTWCQWCPCGHEIVNGILQNYPNTTVLAYHGGSDPWTSDSSGMISLFGVTGYPTGVVSRRTGIIDRAGWNNPVVIQSNTVQPGVSFQVNNYNYNPTTRTVSASIVATALSNLDGAYNINFILTEDNLVYPQQGNSSCTGGSNYVHHHVVKGVINGPTGTAVNTGSSWNQGVQYTIPLNYVIPAGFVATNCYINMFIYKTGGSISLNSHIQQSMHFNAANGPTGIKIENEIPAGYKLEQNYPNPFNPTTNVFFSIPKKEKVTMKVYDMVGTLVETIVDQELSAGTYNATIDGSKLSSGVYFYTLTTPSYAETKKMTLVK
jgi:hypothetical protein